MNFPTKLDETVGLLAKNTRFSDIEKGTLLLHAMAVHDELADDERRYGESVAAGWMRQRAEEQSDSPQWHQYYGKIRAAQMNGTPTALAESAIGVMRVIPDLPPSHRLSRNQLEHSQHPVINAEN